MISKMKNKVVLGLSGGVDSTAAALLLLERGYDVTGLYFDIHKDDGKYSDGRNKAQTAAKQLGIDFIYKNVESQFNSIVINNFCSEYERGRTPNPCIICNPMVKFKTLIDVADEIGAYYIATGHYAGTYYDEENDFWFIKKATNINKDQSYMLYRLNQETISRLILPLNDVEDKERVRELARKKSMVNANDKDSQEICFIDDKDDYKSFLKRKGIETKKGNFIDSNGNILGQHQGILNYTIGQRKGLGIALGKPVFVTKIDGINNTVELGDNENLFKTEVISSDNYILGVSIKTGAGKGFIGFDNISAKIRYTSKPSAAKLELLEDGRIKTEFMAPQRAATPGQSIVFYDGELVIGGGFID